MTFEWTKRSIGSVAVRIPSVLFEKASEPNNPFRVLNIIKATNQGSAHVVKLLYSAMRCLHVRNRRHSLNRENFLRTTFCEEDRRLDDEDQTLSRASKDLTSTATQTAHMGGDTISYSGRKVPDRRWSWLLTWKRTDLY